MADCKADEIKQSILNPQQGRLPVNPNILHHELLERADEFIQAVHALPQTAGANWPRYALIGHAVELALKSFLASRGFPEITPKKNNKNLQKSLEYFRHDLKSLLDECEKFQGLAITDEIRHVVYALNVVHKHHWARYPSGTATMFYTVEGILPEINSLLSAVRIKVRGGDCRFIF